MENKNEAVKKLAELGLTPADCKICKDDFFTSYAKILAKSKKQRDLYRKYIVAQYNKDKDLAVFLHQLKTLAKAENFAELAKKTKIHRPNLYRMLSGKSDLSFSNFEKIVGSLGIEFRAACLSR